MKNFARLTLLGLAVVGCVLGACGSGSSGNNRPHIESTTATPNPVENGSSMTITVSATDADGDDLTYHFCPGPSRGHPDVGTFLRNPDLDRDV